MDSLRPFFPELEILGFLGSGGMGSVYKARQPRLDRIVALKIMTCGPEQVDDFAIRFEREARVLARLNHPHIVSIFDFGEVHAGPAGSTPLFYFIMEFVEGTDLTGLIRNRELASPQALAIIPQICDALQFAHEEGITHRDIKPANILIDRKGNVKIADFGLAKMAGTERNPILTGLTRTGTTIGTPHYMAPEQWDHPESVDHRADIYALGVVIYEMLTGERPVGRFEPPSRRSPVDQRIDKVVMRAMEREPDRRYQQASEVKSAVSGVSSGRRFPRSTAAYLGAAGLLILLLAAGVLSMNRQRTVSGKTPDPAAAQRTPSFPPGEWINVDSMMRGDSGVITGEDGWWSQRNGYHLKIGSFSARNAGIRCRVRGGGEKLLQPILRDHKHTPGNMGRTTGFAVMYLRTPGLTAQLSRLDERIGMIDLGRFPVRTAIDDGREYLLEFFVIGDSLVARIDGHSFSGKADTEPPEIGTGAAFFNLGTCQVRQVEVINLDGMPESDSFRIAGVRNGSALPVD